MSRATQPKPILLSPAAAKELLAKLTVAETPIDGARLLRIGETLKRPVVHLYPGEKGQPLGVIGGAVRGRNPCRIVIDLRGHPDPHTRGTALLEVDALAGEVSVLPCRVLKDVVGGTPLFGTTVMELPSLDALFFHAEELHPWLRGQGWEPDSGFNNNFPEAEVAGEYEDVWSAAHPLFSRSMAWAQIGGWPITWPEEPYSEQQTQTLVVRTYHDSEPWLEVLQQPSGALRLAARAT